MPDKRVVKILLAAPSDVAEERRMAEEVIQEWNIRNSKTSHLALEALLWESHASSGSGARAQATIIQEIVDACDFAVGIFWTRIGTLALPDAAVEVVEKIVASGKPLMHCFSNVAYRRKDVDFEQITALDRFKESLPSTALIEEYDERHEFREKFAHQLDTLLSRCFPPQAADNSDTLHTVTIPKVFIAYSWDDEAHKRWVADLATRLRGDGVESRLDQWHAVPGDKLPRFMEQEIRENDFVLIICTPRYRLKFDGRDGGAGYEGDIMTGEVYKRNNDRKFIPILAKGSEEESMSSWLKSKFYIDLSTPEGYERDYPHLLATLLNTHPVPPAVKLRAVATALTPDSGSSQPAVVETPRPSFPEKYGEQAEYIKIPGGSYLYSVSGKEVRVPDLYMAKYPVTNKLYRQFIAFLEANKGGCSGSRLSAETIREELKAVAKRDLWWPKLGDYLHEGKNDLGTLFRSKLDEDPKFNGENQPVVGISWYAARAYCLWLSLLEGSTMLYRLPTEVEWEWAAGGERSGAAKKVRTWPWPEEEGDLSIRLANYNNNVGATTVVDSHPDGATPEGLYDMAGNVWEWMDNWYDAAKKEYRALRGGSWLDGTDLLRCSARFLSSPQVGDDCFGFRVVRSSPSS